MNHCHECDSDVADNDIFCPYCGISMVAAEASASDDGDVFSKTIVISAPVPAVESVVTEPQSVVPFEPALAKKENETDEHISVASTSDLIGKTSDTAITEDYIDVEVPETEVSSADIAEDSIAEIEEAVIEESQKTVELINHEIEQAGSESLGAATAADDIASDFSEALAEKAETPEDIEIAGVGELAGDVTPDDETDFQPESFEIGAEDAVEDALEASEVLDENIPLEEIDVEATEEVENIVEQEIEAEIDQPDDDDLGISDVPTPILLTTGEIANTIEKIGAPDLEPSAFDIEMPTEVETIDAVEDEVYVAGNAVLPLIANSLNVQTNDEVSTETDTSPEQPNDAPPIAEPETLDDSIGDTVSDDVDDPENPVAVTDEPLLAVAVDTGDDMPGNAVQSSTTPITGSSDTDGRKSGLKPLVEGTVLNNRYDIVKKIGGGGMGAVYLANDRNLGGVQRAVKEMVQSHIEEEQQEKAVDDFKRESMILSTLDHPSIPTIYDYFFDAQESRFYLVMKYISGGDLAGKLRSTPEGRIDERTVTEWSLQIIDVLDYLHNLPTTIVYRDLKPSNVMIDGNTGRIMLIDFGIARSINQNQEKGVTAVGTMGYAPPELFSGNVEPRSDIYSLGSTMFHLMTGADPQNNPLLIFDFQKNPRPRQINPQLSDQMERILMRSVEYNADARFTTAAEMKHALSSHLDNLRTGQITYGVTEVPQSVSLSHQIVFCGFCGQRIVATDMFCAFCGSKQPLAQHGVHAEVYSRSVGTARLVIEGTSELNIPAYSIEKDENLVGRRDPMSNIFPEVDLSKYDPQTKISRRHAKIWRDGGNFLVEDLGSSNGTILLTKVSDSLRLVPHQPHPIASGDRLRIGDTTLQFIVG